MHTSTHVAKDVHSQDRLLPFEVKLPGGSVPEKNDAFDVLGEGDEDRGQVCADCDSAKVIQDFGHDLPELLYDDHFGLVVRWWVS